MLRQIRNLMRRGRIRTTFRMPRSRKPRFLRERPELEMGRYLELLMAHYGKPDDEIFFVQIGAFDGITNDPLYDLVRARKWRGILVEPQPDAFEKLKQNYAGQEGLVFENGAVGATDGELTLYTRTSGGTEVASSEKELVAKPGHRADGIRALTVPCWTVRTLLERHDATSVDLLQIDAEGLDFEIIKAIDFDSVAPPIIRFEHTIISGSDFNACLAYLAERGYRFLLEDTDTIAYRGEN